jgi:hypothetical protein
MKGAWHGGKGSRYRAVDQQKYNENWERIFGKKKKPSEEEKSEEVENEDKASPERE